MRAVSGLHEGEVSKGGGRREGKSPLTRNGQRIAGSPMLLKKSVFSASCHSKFEMSDFICVACHSSEVAPL